MLIFPSPAATKVFVSPGSQSVALSLVIVYSKHFSPEIQQGPCRINASIKSELEGIS